MLQKDRENTWVIYFFFLLIKRKIKNRLIKDKLKIENAKMRVIK